jgi:hypothetical protein
MTFLISFGAFAQITVTNAIFPVPGDTLRVKNVVQNVASVQIGNAGPNQTWDLSSLGSGTLVETIYESPSNSPNAAAFAGATSYIKVGGAGAEVETFFKNTSTTYASLGTIGSDVTGLGIEDAAVFNQPYVLQRAPLSYPSAATTAQTSATIRFSIDDLPAFLKDSLLNTVPLQLDSLGFGLNLSRTDNIDAWGTMKIPGGEYEVLREKRVEIRAAILEAKLPFIGWTDVTSYVSAIGGIGNIGQDTTVTYYFYNNASKEPIALINTDASGQNVQSVQYKSGTGPVGSRDLVLKTSDLLLSPNPAIDQLNVEINGLAKGVFEAVVVDLNGKKLISQLFTSSNNIETISLNVSKLNAGAYSLVIINQNGLIQGATRFQVVR